MCIVLKNACHRPYDRTVPFSVVNFTAGETKEKRETRTSLIRSAIAYAQYRIDGKSICFFFFRHLYVFQYCSS